MMESLILAGSFRSNGFLFWYVSLSPRLSVMGKRNESLAGKVSCCGLGNECRFPGLASKDSESPARKKAHKKDIVTKSLANFSPSCCWVEIESNKLQGFFYNEFKVLWFRNSSNRFFNRCFCCRSGDTKGNQSI